MRLPKKLHFSNLNVPFTEEPTNNFIWVINNLIVQNLEKKLKDRTDVSSGNWSISFTPFVQYYMAKGENEYNIAESQYVGTFAKGRIGVKYTGMPFGKGFIKEIIIYFDKWKIGDKVKVLLT